jgi:hypothetical protein
VNLREEKGLLTTSLNYREQDKVDLLPENSDNISQEVTKSWHFQPFKAHWLVNNELKINGNNTDNVSTTLTGVYSRNHFCTGDTTISFISIVGVDVAINHAKVYCCYGNATVGSYSLLSSHKIFHTAVNKNKY